MSSIQGTVMPDHFTPKKRGRKPIYDITPILEDVSHVDLPPSSWLKYEMPVNQARSAKRQLEEKGFETTVDVVEDGQAHLYVFTKL